MHVCRSGRSQPSIHDGRLDTSLQFPLHIDKDIMPESASFDVRCKPRVEQPRLSQGSHSSRSNSRSCLHGTDTARQRRLSAKILHLTATAATYCCGISETKNKIRHKRTHLVTLYHDNLHALRGLGSHGRHQPRRPRRSAPAKLRPVQQKQSHPPFASRRRITVPAGA